MIVRKPAIPFERSLPHWNAAEPEFSQINNAASSVLPHLEPYLIKVMLKAREALNAHDDADLLESIDLFIRQEANHYKLHQQYNDTLYKNGYPGLRNFEQQLADDYKVFLAERSLKFNVAYTDGFESLGLIQAEFVFRHADAWLEGADESVRALWEWHLAEEYEHRSVCFDVYQALYGGYFYRIYGLLYAARHLFGYGKRVSDYLIAQDIEQGRIQGGLASWWRQKRYRAKLTAFSMVKLLRVFSPFYNPARLSMPTEAAVRLNALGS